MQPLGKRSERSKDLRRRIRRRRDGEVIVDGSRLVDDLVRWRVPIRELYLAASLAGSPAVEDWLAAASHAFVLDDALLAQIAPTRSPQGVLAVVDEPGLVPWEGRRGIGLWLDGIQDPGNLGAIIRVAAGLDGQSVLCGPACADPYGPTAVRGAAGAVFRLPVSTGVSLSEAVDLVRRQGGEVWATGVGGVPVDRWRPAGPLLLLLGAEGRGLSSEALASADNTVSIELSRDIESLNVSVAAGVLLASARYCKQDSISLNVRRPD